MTDEVRDIFLKKERQKKSNLICRCMCGTFLHIPLHSLWILGWISFTNSTGLTFENTISQNPCQQRTSNFKFGKWPYATTQSFQYMVRWTSLRNWCKCILPWEFEATTFRSMMNAKLSLHSFWTCHENELIKTIQMIPRNLHVSFKLTSLCCGLRLILVYPNPQ